MFTLSNAQKIAYGHTAIKCLAGGAIVVGATAGIVVVAKSATLALGAKLLIGTAIAASAAVTVNQVHKVDINRLRSTMSTIKFIK